jgi:Flp pilus assembly pilin Flp
MNLCTTPRVAGRRSRLTQSLGRFIVDCDAATAIEYGLMVGLIGLAIASTIFGIGSGISTTLFGGILSNIQNAK